MAVKAHDLDGADVWLPAMQAGCLIADKAYAADERVISRLTEQNKTAAIPTKANRKIKRDYDRHIYKSRHLIENFFAKLKQFRAIATRYDKTAKSFRAGIYIAATTIWLKKSQNSHSEWGNFRDRVKRFVSARFERCSFLDRINYPANEHAGMRALDMFRQWLQLYSVETSWGIPLLVI